MQLEAKNLSENETAPVKGEDPKNLSENETAPVKGEDPVLHG